jgi:uncharacterized protein YdiU (UPF0061 family)
MAKQSEFTLDFMKYGWKLKLFSRIRTVPLSGHLLFNPNYAYLSFAKASTANKAIMQNQASTPLLSPTELQFDNRNVETLPISTDIGGRPRQTPNVIFSLVDASPVEEPDLIAVSRSALVDLLCVKPPSNSVEEAHFAEYCSGNKPIPGSRPAAHCYCGHQFGNFAGQLGDGATMYLGEVINAKSGERQELQLKGAGKTPYSRTADGRKVLRSSVREFLCSEAVHFLNIPTTRAATCVTSSSTVQRDPHYDGGNFVYIITFALKCVL